MVCQKKKKNYDGLPSPPNTFRVKYFIIQPLLIFPAFLKAIFPHAPKPPAIPNYLLFPVHTTLSWQLHDSSSHVSTSWFLVVCQILVKKLPSWKIIFNPFWLNKVITYIPVPLHFHSLHHPLLKVLVDLLITAKRQAIKSRKWCFAQSWAHSKHSLNATE